MFDNEIRIGNVSVISDSTDVTLYVNASTGSDYNDGLDSSRPLATIQEAIDRCPKIINCNITIQLAAGTYREQVSIKGYWPVNGKILKIIGDSSTPSNVVISGADSGAPTTPVRDFAITVEDSRYVYLEGLTTNYANSHGVYALRFCLVYLTNVESTNNVGSGFAAVDHTTGYVSGGKFNSNGKGISVIYHSSVFLSGGTDANRIQLNSNSSYGCETYRHSFFRIQGTSTYVDIDSNTNDGVYCYLGSSVEFGLWVSPSPTIRIRSNGGWGVKVDRMSLASNCGGATYSGNTSGTYSPTTVTNLSLAMSS